MKTEKLIICFGNDCPAEFSDYFQKKSEGRTSYFFERTIKKRVLPGLINKSKVANIIVLAKHGVEIDNFKNKIKTSDKTVIFFEIQNLYDYMLTTLDFGVALGKLEHLYPGLYSFFNGKTTTIH